MSRLTAALLAEQRADGAFCAEVVVGDRTVDDHSVFSTVQVVRALADLRTAALVGARDRALDYLLRSRSAAGTHNHWPADQQPGWLPRLPDDADDTALATLVLWVHGRITRADAVRVALGPLARWRLDALAPFHPPWLGAGAFLTWLAPGPGPNLVDAVVNANVVALYAALGLHDRPEVSAAGTLIARAVDFARAAPPALRGSIAPFYPDLHELDRAIVHAVALGARGLAGLPRLTAGAAVEAAPLIARAAYGGPRWRSRAVGLARRLGGESARGDFAV